MAPLFISDVLIALSFLHNSASSSLKGLRTADRSLRGRPTVVFSIFVAFVVVRALASLGQAPLLDLLRDAVPFIYGVLAFFAAASLARSAPEDKEVTYRVFKVALNLHLAWAVLVSVLGQGAGFDILGPFGSAPLFEIRPDIDVALASIAAALALRSLLLSRNRFWNSVVLLLALAFVFLFTSTRAGQISLIVALMTSFVLTYAASRRAAGRRLLMVAMVPIIIALAAVVIPQTQAGERLIASLLPQTGTASIGVQNAQGTSRARQLTWTETIAWTNEDPARAFLGSGFGNNFLVEAGTVAYLEGTTYTDVRSPHNWFVGIYARLGLAGIALTAGWLLQLLVTVARRQSEIGQDDLLAFGLLTVVAILPVAAFGVVLEAPFGAIPFFWAVGLLMGSARKSPGVSGRFSSLG